MRAAPCHYLLLLAITGCVTAPGEPTAESLRAEAEATYVSAAKTEEGRRAPATAFDLDQLNRTVERARQAMDAATRQPATVARFRDFSTPESRRLQELAGDPKQLSAQLAEGIELPLLDAAVLARNPEVAAAYRQLRSALERYPQVVHLDTLASQFTSFQKGIQRPPGMSFPFPGATALKSRMVQTEVELARAGYQKVVRDQVAAAETALLDLWYQDQALATRRETLSYLEQLERTLSSRMETARAEKSQLLQVQVEVTSLEDELETIQERQATLRARLRQLLDLDTDTAIGAPSLVADPAAQPPSREAAMGRAAATRPELLAARARLERVRVAIELGERMTYPNLAPGLQAGAKGTMWLGQQDAYLREARERRRALEADLASAERRTEFLVEKSILDWQEAARRLELYEDVLLSQARQAYEDTLAAYQAERVSFQSVIDTLRKWLELDLGRHRARRDLLLARIELEAAIGAPSN